MEATTLKVGEVKRAINQMNEGNKAALRSNGEVIELLGPYALQFHTVKHKHIDERRVPLDAVALQFFESYLNARKRHLRKLGIHSVSPNDPFLISAQTGKGLRPNTITHELAQLTKQANIERSCSPHLIRHLYVVRLFVRFLLAHEIETIDQFKRALKNKDAFKEQVRELTGHASIDSLDVYLNLAINQISNLKRTISRVAYQGYVDSLTEAKDRISAEVKRGKSSASAFEELSKAVTGLQAPFFSDKG